MSRDDFPAALPGAGSDDQGNQDPMCPDTFLEIINFFRGISVQREAEKARLQVLGIKQGRIENLRSRGIGGCGKPRGRRRHGGTSLS